DITRQARHVAYDLVAINKKVEQSVSTGRRIGIRDDLQMGPTVRQRRATDTRVEPGRSMQLIVASHTHDPVVEVGRIAGYDSQLGVVRAKSRSRWAVRAEVR